MTPLQTKNRVTILIGLCPAGRGSDHHRGRPQPNITILWAEESTYGQFGAEFETIAAIFDVLPGP